MKILNLKIIACNVMWRELCYYASQSPNKFEFNFLPWGLHRDPRQLHAEVQKAVDATSDAFDAILLGYGLCSKGVEGISAHKTRLVITRGHDCITCFLGSKTRYREYFDSHPGTYWYTPGWIENHLSPGKERYETIFEEYKKKFGEDDAEYLMEMEQGWFKQYTTAAYVDLGVGDGEPYKEYTRRCAKWLDWHYDEIKGDSSLFRRFVGGDWNTDEFLIVEPGHQIEATNDEAIVRSVPTVEAT
ncbi:MAG: DUF1638 domain-containing protein [Methylacidiphilales bacterium]|nr:DUF1638 domain-containing protein [Candidatus Methylacidiphilales bacterium]